LNKGAHVRIKVRMFERRGAGAGLPPKERLTWRASQRSQVPKPLSDRKGVDKTRQAGVDRTRHMLSDREGVDRTGHAV